LYAALDVGYINQEKFNVEYQQAEKTKALRLKRSLKHETLEVWIRETGIPET
jgi:hypothetical protein